MALKRLDPEMVRRWVEESCAAQGVEVRVTEEEAVGRAAALLREGRRPHRPAGHPHDDSDR